MSESSKPQEPEQNDDAIEEPEVEGHSQDDEGEETPWCGVCKVAS